MSDTVEETLPDIQLAQSVIVRIAVDADNTTKCGLTCRYLKKEDRVCALFDCTLMRPGFRCNWCIDAFPEEES